VSGRADVTVWRTNMKAGERPGRRAAMGGERLLCPVYVPYRACTTDLRLRDARLVPVEWYGGWELAPSLPPGST